LNADLHSHSTASDGLLAPRDLVARAAANGVELLCLTDHDDTSGIAEARAEASERGIRFVDGVEVSVTWHGATVHVVGLRIDPESALGCERYYLAPAEMLSPSELSPAWGLLEIQGREIRTTRKSKKNLRGAAGLANEMNLLLASLRRVELRIDPQTITDFLKWKNRMARYNGGVLPIGLEQPESNLYLGRD